MIQSIGPVIVDIKGLALTPEERDRLRHPLVGGVILFARNFVNSSQLSTLCAEIRATREQPILITVDQEGGRVQRFPGEGFTRLPAMGALGNLYEQDPQLALQIAENLGWLMAGELLAAGIDLSFAPVLDLNKQLNTVIGNRAFHANPAIVIALATQLMKGMSRAGMAAVGKHFPGHGSVTVDSHHELPIDARDWLSIEAQDLQPFKALIPSLQGIMSAHLLFPKVDKQVVSFSSYWLKTILREKLHFQGVVFSDDLNMKGSDNAGDYPTRALRALEAGCDFILICNNPQGAQAILDHLPKEDYKIPLEKIRPLQGRSNYAWDELQKLQEWSAIHHTLSEMTKTKELRN